MEFVKVDIRDVNIVSTSLMNVDAVVHLAAQISVRLSVENHDLTFDVNLFSTLNLLRYSAQLGVEKFVFDSICAVYGDTKVLPISENVKVNPIAPYAESKLLG